MSKTMTLPRLSDGATYCTLAANVLPELVKALEESLSWCTTLHRQKGGEILAQSIVRIRAAIAAAREVRA